jgi:hypothetical protein
MGLLVAFAVGYVIGARGGNEGFDEVVRATAAIRDSDEFRGLTEAVRAHAAHTFRELAARLDEAPDPEGEDQEGDLLAQVRRLTRPD